MDFLADSVPLVPLSVSFDPAPCFGDGSHTDHTSLNGSSVFNGTAECVVNDRAQDISRLSSLPSACPSPPVLPSSPFALHSPFTSRSPSPSSSSPSSTHSPASFTQSIRTSSSSSSSSSSSPQIPPPSAFSATFYGLQNQATNATDDHSDLGVAQTDSRPLLQPFHFANLLQEEEQQMHHHHQQQQQQQQQQFPCDQRFSMVFQADPRPLFQQSQPFGPLFQTPFLLQDSQPNFLARSMFEPLSTSGSLNRSTEIPLYPTAFSFALPSPSSSPSPSQPQPQPQHQQVSYSSFSQPSPSPSPSSLHSAVFHSSQPHDRLMMRPFLSNPSLEFFSTIAYPTVHFPHQNITKSHSAGARTTNTPIAPAVSLAKTDTSINKSRTTRPKIVKGKAIQCHALNSKRGSQCRNAALMEYIGPRPHYCAEHIDQDPESLYTKCKSEYYKARDDRKGCKEIVLKEFVMCHKHFEDHICCFDKQKTLQTLERVTQLLSTLTSEAEGARKVKVDLFQRKNKIIPKFQRMKSLLESRMALSFSSDESHADVNENVNDNPSLSHPFSLQSVPTSSSGSCSASPSQPPTPPCNETADTDDDHDVGGSPQIFQPSFEGGNEEEDGEEEDGEAEEGRDIKEC